MENIKIKKETVFLFNQRKNIQKLAFSQSAAPTSTTIDLTTHPTTRTTV